MKKAQLFFVFLLLITGVLWIMAGPAATAEQKHFRFAVGAAETVGLVITTMLAMRKR